MIMLDELKMTGTHLHISLDSEHLWYRDLDGYKDLKGKEDKGYKK